MPIKFSIISLAEPGVSSPARLSKDENPVNLLIGIQVTGTATYDIEVCMDAGMASYNTVPVTPFWYKLADRQGLTATSYTQLDMPITGVRLNMTAGSGSLVMNVNQFIKG